MTKSLTVAGIERIKPGPAKREIRDGTTGLILLVQTSGVKSFIMRFRRPNGRHANLTIGRYDPNINDEEKPVIGQPLSLGMARVLAAEVRRQRTLGIDVVADHRVNKLGRKRLSARNSASTFPDEARRFVDEYKVEKGSRRGQQPRTWRETAKLLGLDYPVKGSEPTVVKGSLCDIWRDTSVMAITRDAILDLIKETERSGIPGIAPRNGGKSENRGRHFSSALGTMFRWLEGERRIAVNPFIGMKRPRPGNKRKRLLNFKTDMNDADEVRWFWSACGKVGGPFGAIAKLLLLTLCRLDEIAKMETDELSTGATMLRLPGDRTKNGLDHDVSLSPSAREILDSVPRLSNRFVFSTNGRSPFSGFSKKKKELDAVMLALAKAEMGNDYVLKRWRLHDLRRTGASGMGHLKVAPHVVEMCLNHALGGYNLEEYQEERRQALEKWADHVAGIVEPREPAKVVSIRKGRP
jgi:integrase